MQVTPEPLEPCQVALTIEVEQDKVVSAVDQAYREYAKHVSAPGFRKGKAPISIVKQRVPLTDVKQRTAEILVEPAYAEAILEAGIKPYAQPTLELLQLELGPTPFIFKAIVPLFPSVELWPYTGLSLTRKIYTVSDLDVENQLARIQQRSTNYPMVDRGLQVGDVGVIDLQVDVAGSLPSEAKATTVEIGGDNVAGLDNQLMGLMAGEEKEFTLTYPEDYPEPQLAGKLGFFQVKVKEVREKQIPALDDELAKSVTGGRIASLDELRADVRKGMDANLLDRSNREAESKLIDQVVSTSVTKFPPVMTEAEVEDDLKELSQRLEKEHVSVEDYLMQIGKSQEQVVGEIRAAAERRIRIGLVLGEISEKENLTLTEEDVQEQIRKAAAEQNTNPAAMRAYLESTNELENMRNRAQTQKVLNFLMSSAVITDEAAVLVPASDPSGEATALPEDGGDTIADQSKESEAQ